LEGIQCLEVNGETSLLGDQWKESNTLMLMGRHFVWCPMEGSKFGGLWKEKEKHPFHFFSFSPLKKFI
jgi:hypothetical protein